MNLATAPVHAIEAVCSRLGIAHTPENLAGAGPPPQPLLRYLTFFDPGWSIVKLRSWFHAAGPLFSPQSWYVNEPFAHVDESPRYRQIGMEPLPFSGSKAFDEQLFLLPPDVEPCRARVAVAGLVIHFLETGERLFPAEVARCVDQSCEGDRVYVGNFGAEGLHVGGGWDFRRYRALGLFVSRKTW